MKTESNNYRNFLLGLAVFAIGCLIVALPLLIRERFIHANETAGHEQTMAPGITMLMGLIAAPFGGAISLFVWWWFRRRTKRLRLGSTHAEPNKDLITEQRDSTTAWNPYEATAHPSERPSTLNELPLMPMTSGVACAVSVFHGAAFAAVIAFGLSFFVLTPPMCHWFDLNGEFDGFIVLIMPPLAAGCTVLPGLLFAAARTKAWRVSAALTLAAAISVVLTPVSLLGNSHSIGAITVGSVLFLATSTSVLLLSLLFRHIEKRRARAALRKEQGDDVACPVFLTGLVWGLTFVAAICLLFGIFNRLGSGPVFVQWGTFVGVPLLMLVGSYAMAVYPFHTSLNWVLRVTVAMTGYLVIRLGLLIL